MKKLRTVVVLVGLVAFFILSAFESDRLFEITAPNNFVYAYSDQSKGKIAQNLNISEEELNTSFEENNIKYLAIGDCNRSQIRVCIYEDAFSKKTENLSGYSEKDIKKIGKQLVDNTKLKFDVFSRDAVKYIKISENLTDSGGNYYATQYITVWDGKVFNISFYNSDKESEERNLKVLDTFEIKSENSVSKTPVFLTIVIAIGIAGFAAVIVAMIFGIIKDKKSLKQDEAEENTDKE